MRNVAAARTSPSADAHPGTHALRGHAAFATRAYGGYVRLRDTHALWAAYGNLYDAVAERMVTTGDAYNVSVSDLRLAYKQAKMDSRGFLLRVNENDTEARLLSPFKANAFVGNLMQQAGLYNRPASQKKVDTTERNEQIRARIWAYVRKDLACKLLPEPFVEEIRADFAMYVSAHNGRSLASKKAAVRRLLTAQGYVKVSAEVSADHGTNKSYKRLFAMALQRYTEQNEYLTVGDIHQLARESEHDMRPSREQGQTVEAAMRSLFRTSRQYQFQQYKQENKMRFALEHAVVTANKDTLNRDDIVQAMATAELPRSSRRLCTLMLPAGELTATDLVGTAEIQT